MRSVRGTGGGPEKTILLGAARSDPSEYDVTVCYIRDQRDQIFGPQTKAKGLPIDYREIFEKNSFDPFIWPQIRALIREKKIDIIHAHDYKTDLLTLLLAKKDKAIPLSTAHGWTGHSKREQVYYRADKMLLKLFPKVIAVSSEIRNELIKHGIAHNKAKVILNGIDPQAFKKIPGQCENADQRLGLPSNKIIIGSVGRLEPQKNFDLLMEVFSELRKCHDNIFLAIAGDGSLNSHLQEKIGLLKLEDSCKLLGHQNDVTLLHHAFDLFVQSSDYEGTANTILEAMALETPIVATDAGGTAELVRDGIEGIIVPTKNHSALRDAIKKVLEKREDAVIRSKAARIRIETDLSFNTRMQKVEALYRELMQNKNN